MKSRSTTIIGLIHNGKAAMAGDGQITFDDTILKTNSSKIRTMQDGTILAGFAGPLIGSFGYVRSMWIFAGIVTPIMILHGIISG